MQDIALTTNGSLLTREKALALRDAGLNRITVSLDSLDDAVFRRMNDVDFPVARVLDAIDAAADAGLDADQDRRRRQTRRERRQHRRDGAPLPRNGPHRPLHRVHGRRQHERLADGRTSSPAREIAERIAAQWPIEPLQPNYFGEVAERWRYLDGAGEIGIISSVTQPFCGSCTRARLSADGKLYLCLFAGTGHDLRALLRGGADDETITAAIRAPLAHPRRPLLRNPLRGDAGAEGGDVAHRRVERSAQSLAWKPSRVRLADGRALTCPCRCRDDARRFVGIDADDRALDSSDCCAALFTHGARRAIPATKRFLPPCDGWRTFSCAMPRRVRLSEA